VGLFGVPDRLKYFVVRDPVDQVLARLRISLKCRFVNIIVEVFDALDSLFQELRLETLLDEFQLENILPLLRLLAGH
jgi:hypothetical protein